jgi:hypothetical protein
MPIRTLQYWPPTGSAPAVKQLHYEGNQKGYELILAALFSIKIPVTKMSPHPRIFSIRTKKHPSFQANNQLF